MIERTMGCVGRSCLPNCRFKEWARDPTSCPSKPSVIYAGQDSKWAKSCGSARPYLLKEPKATSVRKNGYFLVSKMEMPLGLRKY